MKLTRSVAMVLQHLLSHTEQSGWDLTRTTGIAGGTVYPILRRMEDAGWIVPSGKQEVNKRQRQCYALTNLGREQAESLQT